MSDATPDADSTQPPRQRSAAQIEASRSNGARGRGPVTNEGKAASAQNATKHGLRAQGFALLPDEDAGAFESLRQRLVAEHDPQGAVEEALVEQLALALWRARRVEALEVEALTEARERRPSTVYAGGYNPHSPALWSPERMNTILRYRAQLERSLHRTLKALAERRAARAEEERTNEPEAQPPEARPEPAAPTRTNEPELPAPLAPSLSAAHEREATAHKAAWIAAMTPLTSALGLAATWRSQESPPIVAREATPPGSRT